MDNINSTKTTLCPSARPEWSNSKVFGVVGGTVENPHIAYIKKPQPVTKELMDLSDSVTPTEVFRIASPCAKKGCQHFDGKDCGLAMRIVEQMSEVTEELPPCSIRRDCRWWQQEGKSACLRCPQIITDNYNPDEIVRRVAAPTVS